jgi:protein TonB
VEVSTTPKKIPNMRYHHKMNRERLTGLLVVIALHVVLLYGLWRYHIISMPNQETTVMVDLINSTPEPPKPQPPEPPKPQQSRPPEPQQQITAAVPVTTPDEPVAPPPIQTPPPPAQPTMLSGELSVSCPDRSPPAYPQISQHLGEQGTVILQVELDESGHVAEAKVKTSSVHARLDKAALDVIKSWRCKPKMENGVAVRTQAVQPFDFNLKGK